MEEIAPRLLAAFGRIVARDGGAVKLLASEAGVLHLGYAPGEDPNCDGGACILPHLELQQMMQEWLDRSAPGTRVTVRLIGRDEPAEP